MHPQEDNEYGQWHHSDAQAAQPPQTGGQVATGFPVNFATQRGGAPRDAVPWSTGLSDCFSDVKNCCLTCLFPCVTFGQIAEIIDEGTMSGTASAAIYAVIAATTGHACLYACLYRSKMRNKYRLEESPCNDCLVHCCCHCCALCQEYRELQNRGYNMVMGWHGNLEQQRRGVAMTPTAPTVEPGMTR